MPNTKQIQQTLADAGMPVAQLPAITKEVGAKAQHLQAVENRVKFGNLISKSEGTAKYGADAYRVGFGGKLVDDLSAHPNKSTEFTQTDGVKNKSTAFGKYQFLNSTYQDMAKVTGRSDMSPESQELNFQALLKAKGADKLVDAGDFAGAIKKLGKTFASLPTSPYKQPKNSWDKISSMAQEVGIGSLPVPSYSGELPKQPVAQLSEKNILQAALPTTQENLQTAAKVEQQKQLEREAMFAQQKDAETLALKQQIDSRKNEIDSMLGEAFGFNSVFKEQSDMPTQFDTQLKKLIDVA